jgi:predicted dehydrogenase
VVELLHLPVLACLSGVSIRWFCDSSLDRARRVAGNWNVPGAFAHVEECPAVDAVLVATPVGTRRDILTTTISRGWHALCEKPFAISASEHRDLLGIAARSGVILAAGFMRRHYWAVRQAASLLDARILGELVSVFASESARLDRTGLDLSSYRNNRHASGGGVLFETGCHLLDQVMAIANAFDASIDACAQTVCNDYEVETVASGRLSAPSGATAQLRFAVSAIHSVCQGITLRCVRGQIHLSLDPGGAVEISVEQPYTRRTALLHPLQVSRHQHLCNAFAAEWKEFLAWVRAGEKVDLARVTGLLTSELIEQCSAAAVPTGVEVNPC